MFRAIGYVIILYALSQFFAEPFSAFGNAATAVFETFETAAVTATAQLDGI